MVCSADLSNHWPQMFRWLLFVLIRSCVYVCYALDVNIAVFRKNHSLNIIKLTICPIEKVKITYIEYS